MSALDKPVTSSGDHTLQGYNIFHQHKHEVAREMMKDPSSNFYIELYSKEPLGYTVKEQQYRTALGAEITKNPAQMWGEESKLLPFFLLFYAVLLFTRQHVHNLSLWWHPLKL